MISFETQFDGRRARLFAETVDALPTNVAELPDAEYWDEDDCVRAPLLKSVLSKPHVRAITFATGMRDVLKVFLLKGTSTDDLVFAFVLVSRNHLRQLVREQPYVVENFTFQSTHGERLTDEGIRTAVQVWIERTFPTLRAPPAILLDHWTGPDGVPSDFLRIVHSGKTGEIEDFDPSEGVLNASALENPSGKVA